MALTLRPYQIEAVENVFAQIDTSPILVAPTGAGKTVMGVDAARRLGEHVLWVAHRRELVTQARDAVVAAGGTAGIVMAGAHPDDVDPEAPFQIASVQTLARRAIPEADVLVVDECHHATSDSYRVLIDRFPRRFGLTATPFRLDGKGLRSAGFGALVVAAYTDDLCAAGTLHEPDVYAAEGPDLRGVKAVAGEYRADDLDGLVNTGRLVGNIVETWKLRAEGRRTVAFAVTVAHAESIAARFDAEGVPAEIVTGKTPRGQRDSTLARLRHGATLVVVNVGVLTEGWDLPALEAAILARPTASLCLHLQQIGRVMRACDGKAGAIVLDHAGNTHRHGRVTDRLRYSLDTRVAKVAGDRLTHRTCPKCALVVSIATPKCPSCGYEFPRADPRPLPVETKGDLVLVAGKADALHEPFDHRRARWVAYLRQAADEVIARLGVMFPADEDVVPKAEQSYYRRYRRWPLNAGRELINPSTASPAQWEALRRKWRGIAERKGFSATWFIRKCEQEARSLDATRQAG